MRKILMTVLLVISISILPSACSNYGKLRLQQAGEPRVTPEELVRTWKNYEVYYSGIAIHRPSAVLFDPKDDNKTVTVHPWWVKVEDQRMLLEVMDWMTADKNFNPLVWRILGPDNDFYAYLYTAWEHGLIRVVDEETMWINEMSLPKEYPGGNSREGAAATGP